MAYAVAKRRRPHGTDSQIGELLPRQRPRPSVLEPARAAALPGAVGAYAELAGPQAVAKVAGPGLRQRAAHAPLVASEQGAALRSGRRRLRAGRCYRL